MTGSLTCSKGQRGTTVGERTNREEEGARAGVVTPKQRQRDSLETKDAAAKQQTQTQMPQVQAHDNCAQEVEEHDETPQKVGDDGHRQR